MATYAIGDIQGCLDPLYAVLKLAEFNPGRDHLWVAGDLVNRGPDSLGTLRFIKSLPNTVVVLGNHDLHLLAAAHGHKSLSRKDSLSAIFSAPDRDTLLNWLQSQALVHHDEATGFAMVHAGIPPNWTTSEALQRAREVENTLRGPNAQSFFKSMYGNKPDAWRNDLKGNARLRLITNYFTRMRFCDASGRLELNTKTGANTAPSGFAPWFEHKNHACRGDRILFGHWAALGGITGVDNFIALDTGCVWGGALTMLRLEDQRRFSIKCDCVDITVD